MGMGLSIARSIVEAHNGQIWAEDGGNGGALLWIRLPIAHDTPQ
jgi:signal transduction histidine kinase